MSAPLSFTHRWIPAGRDAPTLLLLHGTGGTEDDLLDLGAALLPGAHRLSPRGQVDENGQSRFFRRLAEGVFDQEDLKRRTADLDAFVTAAAGQYGFDPQRVVAVGFSNGANIAASLVLGGYGTLAGAVLLSPMVPFEPQPLPDLRGRAMFVGAGESDPLVSPGQTKRLVQLLTAGGAAVETFWHPGGHRLTREEITAAAAWLGKEQPWN